MTGQLAGTLTDTPLKLTLLDPAGAGADGVDGASGAVGAAPTGPVEPSARAPAVTATPRARRKEVVVVRLT